MTPPNPRGHNQESEDVNARSIDKLESAVMLLMDEVKSLNGIITTYIAAQNVKCANATEALGRHEKILMGDGESKQGVGVRLSNLSLQVKLIMGVLSVVSTTTLGLTVNLLLKSLA